MYIRSIKIFNIKSIQSLEIAFEAGKEAGWHVVIGDNSTGKTTFTRIISKALMSANIQNQNIAADSLDINQFNELKIQEGAVAVGFFFDTLKDLDYAVPESTAKILGFENGVEQVATNSNLEKALLSTGQGYFSAAYGPFRRFSGGNSIKEKAYKENLKLGAHLSVFGEDVALSEVVPFLKDLYVKKLEWLSKHKPIEGKRFFLDLVVEFINTSKLLPHGTQIEEVAWENITFRDGNSKIIDVLEMSDGFRSILSLTLELIRQMRIFYTEDVVIDNYSNGAFNLPGVVIIDEIDAHLHPSWQARIGEWFCKYFPRLQFIVTTHSPIICRACGDNGTIWRLATPGSEESCREIVGAEKNKLVYGNILDAYGTGGFGEGTQISSIAKNMIARKIELQNKAFEQELAHDEQEELDDLRTKFPTHR